MCLGIGAVAHKIDEDNDLVMYEYMGYNWNYPEYSDEKHALDGSIIIYKDSLIEPEIHEKIKKMPSGRKKLIVKRVPVFPDYEPLIQSGKIIINNCTNAWKYNDGIDISATSLVWDIFLKYQKDNKLPDCVSFFK